MNRTREASPASRESTIGFEGLEANKPSGQKRVLVENETGVRREKEGQPRKSNVSEELINSWCSGDTDRKALNPVGPELRPDSPDSRPVGCLVHYENLAREERRALSNWEGALPPSPQAPLPHPPSIPLPAFPPEL